MGKYDRYECAVSLTSRINGLFFDDLNVEELKVTNSVKITNLKNKCANKITGKMIVDNPPNEDIYGNEFIEDLNRFLNLIGLEIKKNGVGAFYKDGKKVGDEMTSVSSAVISISNLNRKISLGKIFTPSFVFFDRIKRENSEYRFICSTLKELDTSTNMYTPILADQLMCFLFKKDKNLKVLLEKETHYPVSPTRLMEEGNILFERETKFRIGDVLKKSIDGESKRYKYYMKGKKALQENKYAFALISNFDIGIEKAKVFILIHAMRNLAAHFIEVDDFDKLAKFKKFVFVHAECYKEPLRKSAYEWIGIKLNFKQ